MYSVISQSDPLEAHSEIADKTEDYLWLKLCQIQFESDPLAPDQFTLQKLQSLLYEEYGKFSCFDFLTSFVGPFRN